TVLPARFGGKSYDLISVEEGVGKLRAAREAREDSALAIIGRTHAGTQPLMDVIQRTRAYQDAGADALCLVGVKDLAHLETIAEGLRVPLMLVTYGNPQLQDNIRLAALGVRIVVNGHAAYFAAIKATHDALREQRGTEQGNGPSASQLAQRHSPPADYPPSAAAYPDVTE